MSKISNLPEPKVFKPEIRFGFSRISNVWLRWIVRIVWYFFLCSFLIVLTLRWINPPTSSFMIQRQIAARWNAEKNFNIHYKWTGWNNISPHLKMAAITSEDQSFAYHWGIDFSSVEKAIDEYEEGQNLRGASTITQQTAKNLFLWPGKSYIRKGIEAYFAILMEMLWPKQRILEVYLNIAEFGNGVYGVKSASERYFNTTPAKLNKYQSALMVTALPAPRRYDLANPSGYMYRRQRWILKYMDLLGNSYYLRKLD